MNHFYLKSIISICIVLLQSLVSSAQWYKLPGPAGGQFNCIENVNNQLWVGTQAGIYISNDDGLTWQSSSLISGSCYSILSFNDTVVVVYQDITPSAYELKSISSFNNGNTWTASTLIQQSSVSSYDYTESLIKAKKAIYIDIDMEVFKSMDGGLTWVTENGPPGVMGVDQLTSNGSTVICQAYMNNPPYFVYYSSDGQSSWQFLDSIHGNQLLMQGNNIVMSKPVPATVTQYWFRTTDMGVSWDTVFSASNANGGYSMYSNSGAMYLYNGSSFFASTDSGITWATAAIPPDAFFPDYVLNSNGTKVCIGFQCIYTYFPGTQTLLPTITGANALYPYSFYSNNNVLFLSSYDSLYRSIDGGLTWNSYNLYNSITKSMVFRGDTVYALNASFEGKFARSYDNGLTWDTLSVPMLTDFLIPASLTEIAGRIYASCDDMLYSDDEGATWNTLPDLPTGSFTCSSNFDTEGYLTNYNNELFAITNGGFTFKYNPATLQWSNIHCFSSPGAYSNNQIYPVGSRLVITGRNKLFLSSNAGLTWQESAYTGLPQGVNGLKIPRNIVSIGNTWFGSCTSHGVYYSNDFGNSWQLLSGAVEFNATGGLTVLNGVLYSGSYYEGIWRRTNAFFNVDGNVYHDVNANGIKDSGEPGLDNIIVEAIPSATVTTTDSSGNYSLLTDMVGTVKANVPGSYGSLNPASTIISAPASGINFGYIMPANLHDLNIDMVNVSPFNPGFFSNLVITAQNSGAVTQTGTIKLKLDTSLQFISSVPPPQSILADTITWTTTSLLFNDQSTIKVEVQTTTGTPLGTFVSSYVEISPIAADTTPQNNVYVLTDSVVGSYDPNDKTCLQGTFFSPAQLNADEELEYVIRFQNTGTFPTAFVTIKDTLSYFFDPGTLRVISSSHPVEWTLSGNGILEFTFNPLQLPPSILDEPGSHGYVKYAIRCKQSAVVGNALTNTAYIYFDFNTPIITNTTLTLIADPAITPVAETFFQNGGIVVYPNPASTSFNLKVTTTREPVLYVSLYNTIGVLVARQEITTPDYRVNIEKLPQGMFIGRVTDIHGTPAGNFRLVKSE